MVGRNSKFNDFSVPAECIPKRRYPSNDRRSSNLARRIKRSTGRNDRLEDLNPNSSFPSFKLVLRISIRPQCRLLFAEESSIEFNDVLVVSDVWEFCYFRGT
jgi:hypothetical protein